MGPEQVVWPPSFCVGGSRPRARRKATWPIPVHHVHFERRGGRRRRISPSHRKTAGCSYFPLQFCEVINPRVIFFPAREILYSVLCTFASHPVTSSCSLCGKKKHWPCGIHEATWHDNHEVFLLRFTRYEYDCGFLEQSKGGRYLNESPQGQRGILAGHRQQ